MECKEQETHNSRQDHIRINRNIVECKGCFKKAVRDVTPVLIETSWNVKSRRYWASWYCLEVLIETSWNVKRYVAVIVAEPVFCINRNIVECKVLKVYTTYIRILRINRNIVECKVCKIIRRIHFWILY